MARERAEGQIYRVDGKGCFAEVMSEAFAIGQVQINFAQYNTSLEKGSRQTAFIPIYLSIPEFLSLASDVMIGRMAQKAAVTKKASETDKSYPPPLFSVLGGTSKDRLREMGKSRADNMSVSRRMTIGIGSKYPYLITAEQGAGQTDAKGLIVPKYKDGKPEAKISIPITEEALRELFAITNMYIQAYITARMVSGEIPTSKQERTDRPQYSRPLPQAPDEKPVKAMPVSESMPVASRYVPQTTSRDDEFAFLDSAPLPEPPPVVASYRKAV